MWRLKALIWKIVIKLLKSFGVRAAAVFCSLFLIFKILLWYDILILNMIFICCLYCYDRVVRTKCRLARSAMCFLRRRYFRVLLTPAPPEPGVTVWSSATCCVHCKQSRLDLFFDPVLLHFDPTDFFTFFDNMQP